MRNHTSLKPDHGERLAGQTAAKADHKNSEMGNQHSFAFFDLLHAAFNNDSVSTEAHIYVMHRYAVMHSACQIIPTLFWLGFRNGGLLLWLLSFRVTIGIFGGSKVQDFSTFWTTCTRVQATFSPLREKSLRLHNDMKSILRIERRAMKCPWRWTKATVTGEGKAEICVRLSSCSALWNWLKVSLQAFHPEMMKWLA